MKINVTPIFATPLISTIIPDTNDLNAALKKLFMNKMNNKEGNTTPPPTNRINIFDSDMTLFDWPDEPIQELKNRVFDILKVAILRLNNYPNNKLDDFDLHCDAWFHITSNGGYISSHVHSMASWSGVYYIDDGSPHKNRPDNGVIRFLDTRAGANMYLDVANFNIQSPFDSGSFNIVPEPGALVIFPSYLNHEVTPFFGDGKRICVAFNVWFTKKGSLERKV